MRSLTQRMAGSEPFVSALIDRSQPFSSVGQPDEYEVAGLMPLPLERMLQQAEKLRQQAGSALQGVQNMFTGSGRSKAATMRKRAETINRVRNDWDPLKSKDRELDNRFRRLEGTTRSRPVNPAWEAERLHYHGEERLFNEQTKGDTRRTGKAGEANRLIVNPLFDSGMVEGGFGYPEDVKARIFQEYDRLMEGTKYPLQQNVVPTLRVTGFDAGNQEYRELHNMRVDPPEVRAERQRRLAEMEKRQGRRLPTGAGGGYAQGESWVDEERLGPGVRGGAKYGNLSPTPLIVPGVGHQFEGI